MKRIRITVIRKVCHQDLIDRYENPIEHACDLQEGMVFVTEGWQRPEGFCESAWQTLSPFVMTLAHGGTNLYDGWMKNPASAMLSCNDGFRPVSFLVEAIGEEETEPDNRPRPISEKPFAANSGAESNSDRERPLREEAVSDQQVCQNKECHPCDSILEKNRKQES